MLAPSLLTTTLVSNCLQLFSIIFWVFFFTSVLDGFSTALPLSSSLGVGKHHQFMQPTCHSKFFILSLIKSIPNLRIKPRIILEDWGNKDATDRQESEQLWRTMRTVCVSKKGGIDICLLSTACSVTLTTLIKVHCFILVWFGLRGKQNPGSTGTRRQGLAAGHTLLKREDNDEARMGLFYSISDAFISTRWWRLPQEMDASFVMMMMIQN